MTGVSEARCESVPVMDWVWHNATRYLDPTPAFPDNGPEKARAANGPKWDYYPRALVEAVAAYLAEDLGCDHQVGICMCGIVEIVKELKLNLDGKKSCPSCGGDGYEYDQATYDAAKAAQIALWGGEEWYDIGDNAGYISCSVCSGPGTVPVGNRMEAAK